MAAQNIIEKLKKRDESGMDELLLHYGPLLRYVIAPILSDERDREEVLQNALMSVWESIGRFDEAKGSWTGWLTAIERNAALNRARAEKRREAGELPENEADPGPTPEEQLLLKERQQALLAALDSLKKSERILFYRKYYYRQSTAQIAAELGITERAAEGKLYRIKQKLRELLEGGNDGR
ncbi:MAG: sigma-70 family RNA polymerase sigma factor [Lachnospiraceae bacterium]|nr:sigma-70 family RNA polymerase sigma factor [Lachnospiraceae bacterium]